MLQGAKNDRKGYKKRRRTVSVEPLLHGKGGDVSISNLVSSGHGEIGEDSGLRVAEVGLKLAVAVGDDVEEEGSIEGLIIERVIIARQDVKASGLEIGPALDLELGNLGLKGTDEGGIIRGGRGAGGEERRILPEVLNGLLELAVGAHAAKSDDRCRKHAVKLARGP